MAPRILIRHFRGTKTNRVDQFSLADTDELTVGRAAANDIRFDDRKEDIVSRHHAVIKVRHHGPLAFTISDLGSRNGVRVNGRPIAQAQDLRSEDLVELGFGGPAFRCGVEEAALASVSDQTDGGDPTIRIPLTPGQTAPQPTPAAPDVAPEAPRSWRGRGLLLLCGLIGLGAIGYDIATQAPSHDALAGTAGARQDTAPAVPHSPPPAITKTAMKSVPPAAAPMRPPAMDPFGTSAAAVVYIEARWRLYDKSTGLPVYQKVLTRRGQRLLCFVETADGQILPWLTTADEDHANQPVGGVVRGSGFIVGGDGSIITTRHIAAGWTGRYFAEDARGSPAALFRIRATPGEVVRQTDLAALAANGFPLNWTPNQGGQLFAIRHPTPLTASAVEGRNESLTVLLPISQAKTPARVVLLSPQDDLAELRIDVGHVLPTIPLAQNLKLHAGDPVTVLGFSAPPAETLDGQTMADGTVPRPRLITAHASLSAPDGPAGLYALALPAAPQGGPVLDADGAALAVVTADDSGRSLAVPASAARALLNTR